MPRRNRNGLNTPRHTRSLLGRFVAGAAVILVALLICFGLQTFGNRVTAVEAAPPSNDAGNSRFPGNLPISQLTEDEAIVHALNRLGYGPQPGEVERIKQMGLETWIAQQLHPEKIDDSALAARLDNLAAPQMTAQALLAQYPQPDAAAKRLGITVAEYRKHMDDLTHPPQGTRPAPSALPQEVLNELAQSKLLRAIYSQRQLEQQLTDFWFNHFNVFAYKDLDLWLLAPYERDAIRPHALGKFRDLLESTAKSPAMLFYLDNYLSADPRAFAPKHAPPAKHTPPPKHSAPSHPLPPLGGKRGLNENYGRELMELHTLGVDGGYNQEDVIAVARAFTGWTIESPRENPVFYFDERIHDPDPKRVLGKNIKGGGIKDGEQVLDLLVKNQNTARHISLQLAQHFVSDDPPPALVARMAKTYEKSKGDIRAVMTTMIYSPEFWSRSAFRAKVKTPFELVASTARALGADVDQPLQLAQWVARIGEPLYQCLTPNGYSDTASTWVSTGSLLNRMNFAVALTNNKIRGAQVDVSSLVGLDVSGNPKLALDRV